MKEVSLFSIFLYFVYYLVFPLIFLILLGWLWKDKNYLEGSFDFFTSLQDSDNLFKNIRKKKTRIKKVQTAMVVFFLIFVPTIALSSGSMTEINMHREEFYYTGPLGGYLVTRDPVRETIGPSFNTEWVIEQMKKDPSEWYTGQVLAQVDLKKIGKIPGRMKVYRMDFRTKNEIIITYTYISPIPITRVFGFRISLDGEEANLVRRGTVIYPMDPGNTETFD